MKVLIAVGLMFILGGCANMTPCYERVDTDPDLIMADCWYIEQARLRNKIRAERMLRRRRLEAIQRAIYQSPVDIM